MSVEQHTQMTHVWGIAGSSTLKKDGPVKNEGWGGIAPDNSTKKRFLQVAQFLNLPVSPLNLEHIGRFSGNKRQLILNSCRDLQPNRMLSLSVYWEGHAISFNIIKRVPTGYHLVYVNRGGHGETRHRTAVQAFTFTDDDVGLSHILELYDASASSQVRDKTSAIANALAPLDRYFKQGLSKTLFKSHQKVGNCTLANQNMIWNLQLATQYMQQHRGASLEDAYRATKDTYKTMRIVDRAYQLVHLLNNKDAYTQESFDALLCTMLVKSGNKGNKQHDQKLLDTVRQIDVNASRMLKQEVSRLNSKMLRAGEIADATFSLLSSTLEKKFRGGQALARATYAAMPKWASLLKGNNLQRTSLSSPPAIRLSPETPYRAAHHNGVTTMQGLLRHPDFFGDSLVSVEDYNSLPRLVFNDQREANHWLKIVKDVLKSNCPAYSSVVQGIEKAGVSQHQKRGYAFGINSEQVQVLCAIVQQQRARLADIAQGDSEVKMIDPSTPFSSSGFVRTPSSRLDSTPLSTVAHYPTTGLSPTMPDHAAHHSGVAAMQGQLRHPDFFGNDLVSVGDYNSLYRLVFNNQEDAAYWLRTVTYVLKSNYRTDSSVVRGIEKAGVSQHQNYGYAFGISSEQMQALHAIVLEKRVGLEGIAQGPSRRSSAISRRRYTRSSSCFSGSSSFFSTAPSQSFDSISDSTVTHHLPANNLSSATQAMCSFLYNLNIAKTNSDGLREMKAVAEQLQSRGEGCDVGKLMNRFQEIARNRLEGTGGWRKGFAASFRKWYRESHIFHSLRQHSGRSNERQDLYESLCDDNWDNVVQLVSNGGTLSSSHLVETNTLIGGWQP